MLKEQFEIAAMETKIRKPELIEAAHAAMVLGSSVGQAAAEFGLMASHLYKAIATIEKKWAEICERRQLVYLPVALPEQVMRVVLEVQAQEIQAYRRDRDKRKSKKP